MSKSPLLILGLILLIALFFRTYQLTERFAFAHDGDLYSWIVKDIAVDHHFRLIGQLTSAEGVFIGPLFYYLLVPFFLISKMDPIRVTLLGTIIGMLAVISYYFVLTRLFNRTVGLVSAFLHASLFATVDFDRWIVPTLPAKLWTIWYLYVIIKLSRGNFSVLPILGILIGLIWHVHIALLPTLLVIPATIILAKKLPSIKQVLLFLAALIITSLPLIIFELRHNFLQTTSLIANFSIQHGGETGLPKFIQVTEMIAKNINYLFLAPQSLSQNLKLPFMLLILLSSVLLIKSKILKSKEALILLTWLLSVVLFFTFSSTIISEYYFANLEIIFILLVSLLITLLIQYSKTARYLTIFILILVLLKNANFFINLTPYKVGYIYRKAAAGYITQDAKNKGYPCIGITYITAAGENVGFRYFFYLNNQHLVHPSYDVPVYNIVLPFHYSSEVKEKFGVIGVIPPTSIPTKETIQKSCETPNTNLTDSLFGYVD